MGKLHVYPKNNTFEKIKAWQLGRELKKELYDVTKRFPEYERYRLSSQIRRASISMTSNIAEGYGRYHFQETIQFARQSRGSVSEILDHLYTALDEEYIDREMFNKLYLKGRQVERAINGYIKFLESQKNRKM
jgi:four helix bundle protein